MLFNSYIFIFLFLPITLIGFYLLKGHKRSTYSILWVIVASLFFYGWWNPPYLILIISSIILNYLIGKKIIQPAQPAKKALLILGITLNLGLICYFKYANFFLENINFAFGDIFHLQKIILPLAISFFTFQQIAYLVDSYKGDARQHEFIEYGFFVTFFPQLIAGPIVHHSEMFPQLKKSLFKDETIKHLSIGLSIFCLGLFKKVVIADGLAAYASPVFSSADSGVQISMFEAWGGAVSYSLQLYFDFSGYSDMAIGLARMFGFKLPMNFYSPYKATSIIDFWRRWHITLSRFLKDYLYIPLGGNQLSLTRRYINLMLTMLLGGLWHGAAWTFVIWGGLHGLFLCINHLWREARQKIGIQTEATGLIYKLCCRVLTSLCIVIAWVFFRAETFSGSLEIISAMFGANGFVLPADFKAWRNAEIYIPWAILIVYCMPNVMEIFSEHKPAFKTYGHSSNARSENQKLLSIVKFKSSKKWALIISLCLALSITRLSSVSEFLYFQF